MPSKPKISDSDREAVSRSLKQSKLVEASRKLARIVKHTDPDPKTKAQRTRLEKSLTAWMKYHGGEAFDQPFSDDHKRVIDKIETALNKGGLFAVAMPRGHGKSTILKWATLYCILTGRRKFVVIVAATAEMAQAVIEFVRQQIQESDTLHAHYPHVSTYARATDGKAIKARFQLRADGKTSGIHWSKTTLVLPEVTDKDGKPYASNGAILEGHGLTGAIRGKWKDTKTGKVLRPDFVLMDDPQTRESAESESQCNMRERIITGDVLGLAGPRKKIAAVMPCTIVQPGDLAARFLDHDKHPEWSGETCKLVDKWPNEQDGLWKEYAGLYRAGISEGRGTKEAFDFYRRHRAAMDKGGVVAWKERVRDGEISAMQTAQNLLIETGEQFWAEYQNDPRSMSVTLYDFTPSVVLSRIDPKRQPGIVPEAARMVLAATDINPSYALTTTLVAFEANQTSAVLWYGLFKSPPMPVPPKATERETREIVYQALSIHGRQLAGLSCRPQSASGPAWFIDGGGTPEGEVIRFAYNSPQICGVQAVACFGRGWKQYRPVAKKEYRVKVGEQLHLVYQRRDRQWIIYNADYWREVMQRGFVSDPGAPGSCTLPAGNHTDFAHQVTREPLVRKGEGLSGQVEWIYKQTNEAHDYGDCMHMAYMGAAFNGIGGGSSPVRSKVKRHKPTISMVKV